MISLWGVSYSLRLPQCHTFTSYICVDCVVFLSFPSSSLYFGFTAAGTRLIGYNTATGDMVTNVSVPMLNPGIDNIYDMDGSFMRDGNLYVLCAAPPSWGGIDICTLHTETGTLTQLRILKAESTGGFRGNIVEAGDGLYVVFAGYSGGPPNSVSVVDIPNKKLVSTMPFAAAASTWCSVVLPN